MQTRTIVMAGAIAALAGCSQMATRNSASNAARDQAEAEAQLCRDMSRSRASIEDFPDVTDGTPLDVVRNAAGKAEEAVADVGKVSRKIDNPQALEVQSAFQQLRNAVDTIPGGRSTVGPAADDVRSSALELRNTWNSLYAGLQCGA